MITKEISKIDDSIYYMLEYIVNRIMDNADDAISELRQDLKNEYSSGREEAYYEVIDTMKGDLSAFGVDLERIGLDFDVDKYFV